MDIQSETNLLDETSKFEHNLVNSDDATWNDFKHILGTSETAGVAQNDHHIHLTQSLTPTQAIGNGHNFPMKVKKVD